VYNTPILRKPFIVLWHDHIFLTTDIYTTVTTLRVTYLRTPTAIAYDSAEADIDLAPYLHEDIAALAVQMFEQQRLTNNEPKGNA
jgi:hypothetical protein